MSQSSPTPDPVAWMVRTPRGEMVAFSNVSEEACREFVTGYPGARLVPLYDHPSALPATTPSAFLEAVRILDDIRDDGWIVRGGNSARIEALLAGIAPSEGIAPDTPEPEDDDDLANQVALQVLCRVFDDGVDVAMDEWRAFNAKGGFFWWARALGAFIRGRLDDQRVPPSAPDTQPDERLAAIRERLAKITKWPWSADVAESWDMVVWAAPGTVDDGRDKLIINIGDPIARVGDVCGSEDDARFIAHAPEDIAYLLSRVSSSPPEGEDTKRLGEAEHV